MSFVFAAPEFVTAAASESAGIGSAIEEAKAAAFGPTTGLVAAAEDEVSALTATLFNSYAQEYHALIGQATAFHDEFAQLLAATGNTYSGAEAQAAGTLAALTAPAQALLAPLVGGPGANPGVPVGKAADPVVDAILIMDGSGGATPQPSYMNNVYSRYLTSFSTLPTTVLTAVTTAEGLYPYTGVKDLTLDISLGRGVNALDNAITQVLGPAPSTGSVSILGRSQSAIIASMEMPKLLAEGYNSTNAYFTLIGDPSNPNGGLFARFPGLSLPSLGITFGTSTPSNDFPTTIWSLEYDGFADFPQYPIDIFSDLNAVAGIVLVHGTYPTLTAGQLSSAVTLGQSGAPSLTTYNMIPTPNLPLLEPLRALPVIGNPLADLLQPDLRYLVNWGYGNPDYGWSTGPADVPTPFGFLPPLGATIALGPDLISGTQQGFNAFVGDLSTEVPTLLPAASLPAIAQALVANASTGALALPTAASIPSTITDILLGLQSANTNIVGTATTAFSTAYATLLPTADIVTALAVSVPSYDFNLFTNGLIQAVNGDPVGLINAIGNPIAADVGLTTLAGGFEFIAIVNSLDTILTGEANPSVY